MNALQATKRITWIDIAKALTIFCVVFGHTLRGGAAQHFVYSFHVVVFFMLSGMTCKTDNLKKRIKSDFFRLMIPYYVFGLISILAFFFLGKFAANQFNMDVDTSLSNNLLELIYAAPTYGRLRFNTPLWFLPCMFVTKIFYYALCKISRQKDTIILAVSAALFTLGIVYTRLNGPMLPFNIQVALKMLLFFAIGRNISLSFSTAKIWNISKIKALIFGALMLIITTLVAYISPNVDYANDTFTNIPAFLVTAFMGSFGICFVSMGIGKCNVLEYVGKNSLPILVMHKFPILVFQTIGPFKAPLAQYNDTIGILTAIGVSAVAVLLCLTVGWFIKRYIPFMFGEFK